MHLLFILAVFEFAAVTPFLSSAPNADIEWTDAANDECADVDDDDEGRGA